MNRFKSFSFCNLTATAAKAPTNQPWIEIRLSPQSCFGPSRATCCSRLARLAGILASFAGPRAAQSCASRLRMAQAAEQSFALCILLMQVTLPETVRGAQDMDVRASSTNIACGKVLHLKRHACRPPQPQALKARSCESCSGWLKAPSDFLQTTQLPQVVVAWLVH